MGICSKLGNCLCFFQAQILHPNSTHLQEAVQPKQDGSQEEDTAQERQDNDGECRGLAWWEKRGCKRAENQVSVRRGMCFHVIP